MNHSREAISKGAAPRFLFGALGLVWLCLFVIALTGYPNLMDNGLRVPSYVLDAVQNGHWLVQHDVMGDVASKPPMLTWLVAPVALVEGHLSRFGIYLPSALATLVIACLIFHAGRTHFNWQAGFLGALAYLLSPVADRQVITARYDGLFALPVMLAALAAFRAWKLGRGWTWFWLAAAAATMVKGPLGLMLGAAGLLAVFWERRAAQPWRLRGHQVPGILLYLGICGGWFALAYWQLGQPLIDKMIGRELVQHSVGSQAQGIGGGFYEPTWNSLTQFLPWSLLAFAGWWRIWRNPSPDLETRRFERFLFAWFFGSLLLFSVSPHQRGRLIFPLVPAAALVAGRELALVFARLRQKTFWRVVVATTVITLSGLAVYHHVLLRSAKHTKETLALKTMADRVRAAVGAEFPLTHVDSPFALQFYLETGRPWITPVQALDLLHGDAAVFLVVTDMENLRTQAGSNAPPVFECLTQELNATETVRIVSNHPRLEWTEHMAMILGPLSLRMDGVQLNRARGNEFVFERRTNSEPNLIITNISPAAERVRVRFAGEPAEAFQERKLSPGETWRL